MPLELTKMSHDAYTHLCTVSSYEFVLFTQGSCASLLQRKHFSKRERGEGVLSAEGGVGGGGGDGEMLRSIRKIGEATGTEVDSIHSQWAQQLLRQIANGKIRIYLLLLLHLLLLRSQLYVWGLPFWVRFLRMRPFFNPTIEVLTFCLCGWCMLRVLLLLAFTCLGDEC